MHFARTQTSIKTASRIPVQRSPTVAAAVQAIKIIICAHATHSSRRTRRIKSRALCSARLGVAPNISSAYATQHSNALSKYTTTTTTILLTTPISPFLLPMMMLYATSARARAGDRAKSKHLVLASLCCALSAAAACYWPDLGVFLSEHIILC